MISAMLFDLDDTLVDHGAAARRGILDLCERYPELGRDIDHEEICTAFSRINGELWKVYGRGEMSSAELRVERKRRLIDWCASRREDPEGASGLDPALLSDWYMERYVAAVRPYDGVLEMLEDLAARCPLGVITNGFASVQRGKIDDTGIGRHLSVRLCSEDLGYGKPDPRIFHEALRRLGVDAGAAIFVGDSFELDVRGAMNAGLRAVWYRPVSLDPLPADPEIVPSAVVDSIEALHSLLAAEPSFVLPAA